MEALQDRAGHASSRRRSEQFAKRDAELTANLEAKRGAASPRPRRWTPPADPDGARKRLRSIHDRWEKIGHVPRDAKDRLEKELG